MDNKNKNTNFMGSPDIKIDTKKIFGFECPFDVTGFDKKNVSLKVEDDQLRLTADQENQKKSNDGTYRIRERVSGKLSRNFTLPDNVISDQINAKFKNGTLTISIPKVEEVKPDSRQIKIS